MYSVSDQLKNHPLYSEFVQVKQRLINYQFVCWLVGGAVRDFCLNRSVADFDLVTDASTENLKTLFPEAILVGESFGILKLVMPSGAVFDLATFREEADYIDGRRPSQVKASTPDKDAFRRDFGINALFFSDELGYVIDYVGGLAQLSMRSLQTVGLAKVRFKEDFLRILRLCRFAAQTGFAVDPLTYQSALELVEFSVSLSGERIRAELQKVNQETEWRYLVNDKLFFNLLNQWMGLGFNLDSENLSRVIFPKLVSSFHFLYLLASLNQKMKTSSLFYKETVLRRFKLSNQDLFIFDKMVLVLTENQKTWESVDIAMELDHFAQQSEKIRLLTEIFFYLARASWLSEASLSKALDLLLKNPQNLVNGHDLKDLVPSQKMSFYLKEIRKKQLSYEFSTKIQSLDWVRSSLK